MSKELIEKYSKIAKKYQIDIESDKKDIFKYIREYIVAFMDKHNRVAIYCYGKHTQMLMIDFVFELKGIVAIIDNFINVDTSSGYMIIRDKDIEREGIDGIIISSYDYRKDIKERLDDGHPGIDYLDIYESLIKDGIYFQGNYYNIGNPYTNYETINALQRQISIERDNSKIENLYTKLVKLYFIIKDFRMAIIKLEEFNAIKENNWASGLKKELIELYECEKKNLYNIGKDNIVMMCIDGLRSGDLSSDSMPGIYSFIHKNAFCFNRAYSFSTSTIESLIPVYKECTDLSTRYYEKNEVPEKECRFIRKAIEDKRHIFFYTDSLRFVESSKIQYSNKAQTITERMWDFINDAACESKGLFYIHHLYESHFSFPNPYTVDEVIADGEAMLFDYTNRKGGKLRTDYEIQHRDAIAYIDDTLAPLLNLLSCRMILFADHGNLVLKKGYNLTNLNRQYLTCHDEWLRVPFAVSSPEYNKGESNDLISILEIPNIVVSFIEEQYYQPKVKRWIKCARSELYNPDFKDLYYKLGEEYRLQAFECFIFDDGVKLVVYSNNHMELYSCKNDNPINDKYELEKRYQEISNYITVTKL